MTTPKGIPLCDRMHGPMSKVELSEPTGLLHGHGFRCQNDLCGRVYTPANSYRDWEQGKGRGRADPAEPRCKTHLQRMYVCEVLPDFTLRYVCPEGECKNGETIKTELGEDGFWKKIPAGRK